MVIEDGISDSKGDIHLVGSFGFAALSDAKIWLVLTSDLVDSIFTLWDPAEYLFEYDLINEITL